MQQKIIIVILSNNLIIGRQIRSWGLLHSISKTIWFYQEQSGHKS